MDTQDALVAKMYTKYIISGLRFMCLVQRTKKKFANCLPDNAFQVSFSKDCNQSFYDFLTKQDALHFFITGKRNVLAGSFFSQVPPNSTKTNLTRQYILSFICVIKASDQSPYNCSSKQIALQGFMISTKDYAFTLILQLSTI